MKKIIFLLFPLLFIISAIAQSEQPYYHSFEEMKAWVDKAIQINFLLVLLFHGVGGGNSLDASIAAHRELLLYITQKQNEIWTAPLIKEAEYIRQQQTGIKN